MKNIYYLLMILTFTVVGCATMGTKVKKPAYVPKFDYTPQSSASTDTAGITFGLVAAHYSEDQDWTSAWPFTEFSRNMALDFQELLIARGFTVRGPFKSIDEMTFPDKKGSDLVLTPSIEVSLNTTDSKYEEVINILGPNYYRLQGTAYIGGRVTLSIVESLTNERMWFKSIELPRTAVQWKGEKKYSVVPNFVDFTDAGLTQALGPSMERFYTKVLETTWNHLHPEEMAMVKNQSQELRAKKVY